MPLRQRKYFLALLACVTVLPVFAQPPACTAPTTLSTLNIERTWTVANVSTAATPNVPDALAAAVASGALELRQQFTYLANQNSLSISEFAVAPGSPSPTPPSATANVISNEVLNVDRIYSTCKPSPILMITGTIQQNYPISPVGAIFGVPASLSFTYTLDVPQKIGNVNAVYGGIGSIFTAAASGSVTFPGVSLVPGPSPTAPVINIAGGITQATAQKQIQLDASKTSSPTGLQLSFAWTLGAGGAQAAISNGTTATPIITFAGKATYLFVLTVTDSKGVSATQVVTVNYYGI